MSALTYVYCVAHASNPVKLGKFSSGLPGTGRARVLDAGSSLQLVVADAPKTRFDEAAIARGLSDLNWVSVCAAAHEAVIERASESATVIPMKLFTLFSSDARALAHLAKMRREIDRIVRRIAGRDEWGVRVLFDERRALRDIAARVERSVAKKSAGTAFLMKKHRQREESGQKLVEAQKQGKRIYTALKAGVDGAEVRPLVRPDARNRSVLDAVFLVAREKEKAFRARVTRVAKELSPSGYEVTLSGPWPPYHFVGGAGR